MPSVFKDTIRALNRNRASKISVPIDDDGEGYYDMECPSCQSPFKVHGDDWQNIVSDACVFCSVCGHEQPADQWLPKRQVEQARRQAVAVGKARIRKDIYQAMKRDVARWNRRQRNALIQLRMKVTSSPGRTPLVRPISARDPMKFKIACPKCACRYAVVGVAFFCPACGHNAADMMFSQALDGIRNVLDATVNVPRAIQGEDTVENVIRGMLEGALHDAVTAFQRRAESLYRTVSKTSARKNVFQSLNEGSELWNAAVRKSYADYLTNDELCDLKMFFQRRHLLSHTQGIVDQDYIDRSGDNKYKVGQRVVIRKLDVRYCVNIIEKLVAGMEENVPT